MPDSRGVRFWVEPQVQPMPEPLVAEVWDGRDGIVSRLTYRLGRERYEPRIMGPAVADEEEE